MKNLKDYLLSRFPITISLYPILIVALALLTISNIKVAFLDTTANTYVVQVLQTVGFILLIAYVALFILEILSKVLPWFKFLLNFLASLLKIIPFLYVAIVKFLIRRAVISIQEERLGDFNSILSENFVLESTNGEDKNWNKAINFERIKSLELQINPRKEFDYWRIGFKFSLTDEFSNARYSENFPLFHLTKDVGRDQLRVDYYDINARHNHAYIVSGGYSNDKFVVKVYREKLAKDLVKIIIYDQDGRGIYESGFDFKSHKFGIISAWGDRKPYYFELKQVIKNK